VRDPFGEDGLIKYKLLLNILVLIWLPECRHEIAVHECLVLAGNLLGSDTVDAVGVITHPDEQRGQQHAHIKTVALLPARHVGRTGDALRELIRRVQLLILHKLAQPLRTFLVVVELEETQFGRSDSGANKFVNVAFVFGVEEELTVLTDVLLELLLELDHVLEDQLLLRSVLAVSDARSLLLLELAATFQLLVYHVLTTLEEL
jgi:hypothetical protein